MSSQELVTAYSEGRISRRALIRRLVAGGVSFGAAIAYAHLLDAERAPARALGDQHQITVTGRILKQELNKVIDKEKLKVKVTVPKKADLQLRVMLHREGHTYPHSLIADKTFKAPKGTTTFKVPLKANEPYSVNALRPLDEAELELIAVARRDGHTPSWGSAGHQRTILKGG